MHPRTPFALAVTVVLVAVPASQALSPSRAIDLLAGTDVQMDGAVANDFTGGSVAGAGDVNGDGRTDLVVGAPHARSEKGEGDVIFGKSTRGAVDLSTVGTEGFRMRGGATLDGTGFGVAGAGDVNGDGYADVIVGAPHAARNSRSDSGSATVVFGSATPASVDLGGLAIRRIRIDGAGSDDWLGYGVGGAADVNGDGLDDAVVGAGNADNNGRADSGSQYRPTLSFVLSRPARMRVLVRRGGTVVGRIHVTARRGANRVVIPPRLGGRTLSAGRYALTLAPIGQSAGGRVRPVSAALDVPRG